jgi:pimeloyl-ACP methyl ester carboxylesterase
VSKLGRSRPRLCSALLGAVAAFTLTGCGQLPISHARIVPLSNTAHARPAGGKAYVFRGMGGRWTSTEMDRLAENIEQTGVSAEVYEYVIWRDAADAAIRRYQSEDRKSAIIVIGHSAGGDAAIRFAQRLEDAGVPVHLLVTFDPTRAAPQVPGNVARFINIYESWNLIGGGDPSRAADFHGQFASIDFKSWNVLHVNVPKISGLQAAVVAKAYQAAFDPLRSDQSAVPIEYSIPRAERIELWDSGIPILTEQGETVSSIATKYSVPVWAIAQINSVDPSVALSANQRLIVPRYLGGGI